MSNENKMTDVVIAVLEAIDDKIPYIGPLMDTPIVDELEKKAVECIVSYMIDYKLDPFVVDEYLYSTFQT